MFLVENIFNKFSGENLWTPRFPEGYSIPPKHHGTEPARKLSQEPPLVFVRGGGGFKIISPRIPCCQDTPLVELSTYQLPYYSQQILDHYTRNILTTCLRWVFLLLLVSFYLVYFYYNATHMLEKCSNTVHEIYLFVLNQPAQHVMNIYGINIRME